MLDRIGWWTFDAETQTLINCVSDQRIRFENAEDDAGSLLQPPASGPARLRFSYQDAEVRYPVLVTARYETYGGSGFDHGDSDRLSLSWSIDHSASAVEWRRSCGTRAEIPPYGLWRRVDDALFDALACWPPSEAVETALLYTDNWDDWGKYRTMFTLFVVPSIYMLVAKRHTKLVEVEGEREEELQEIEAAAV